MPTATLSWIRFFHRWPEFGFRCTNKRLYYLQNISLLAYLTVAVLDTGSVAETVANGASQSTYSKSRTLLWIMLRASVRPPLAPSGTSIQGGWGTPSFNPLRPTRRPATMQRLPAGGGPMRHRCAVLEAWSEFCRRDA